MNISLLKRGVMAMLPALSVYSNSSSSSAAMVVNGSFQVSHRAILDKLKINGEARLGEGTLVQEPMTINGRLYAMGTTFQSKLVANGPSTLSHCKLEDTVHASGVVTARSSQFFKNLTLRTHKSTFSNCQLNTMTVQEIPYGTKQVIHLMKGSIMTGDVTFESGHGEVVVDKTSEVQGTVHGGIKITL